MRDSQVEDRLRGLLRAEGDSLSLTITTAELERRLETRRRSAQGRRVSFLAAAVALVAVGTMVAAANGWVSLPAIGVAGNSPSPAPSPLSSPATVATPSITPIPSRPPLGRPDEAILVRPVGDPTHPTGIEVTRVDPFTGRSTLISTIPESALPQNFYVSGVPTVSRTGWIAIPYNGAGNVDAQLPLVMIADITNPMSEPWIVDGSGQMSWTADERLGVTLPGVYLDDPSTRRQTYVPTPGPLVDTQFGRHSGPVWSTEPGTMLLAMRRPAERPDWGSLDTSGVFTPATDLPAAYQRTGLERPAGAAAHSVGQPCMRYGSTAQTDCSLVEIDANGTPVTTRLKPQDVARPFDDVWAVDGRGLWLLMTDAAAGPTVAKLDYSQADDGRTEIARITLPDSAPGAAILGITDETEPGGALVALGDDAGHVFAFVAPGGSVTSQDGSAWFAGWAGDQPPYDPD